MVVDGEYLYLLDYVTRRFEKLDFKKKKKFCLAPPQNNLLNFGKFPPKPLTYYT